LKTDFSLFQKQKKRFYHQCLHAGAFLHEKFF